jgi:peptidoglycan/xylan/chitin deacetylase (PgdA/CDA1 family)
LESSVSMSSTSPFPSRGASTLVRWSGVLVATCVAVLCFALPARAAAAQTVVSLTFDDGTATEYQARTMLSSHGMHGTFYINSSRLGTDSYYMTWAQLDDIAADGNEIGGHTAYHIDLTATDTTEATRQVCNDRVNLLNRGYNVRSFAYPFGAYNATAQSIVRNCGYNSARSTNQFVPPPSETMPPQDPYAIRVAGAAATGVSLATLESYVTRVEQTGGGWAPLVFHQICNACDGNSISPTNFQAFLDWLQPRASSGTVVRTVGDVVGGATQPAVAGPAAPAPPNGTNALRNASLEQDSDANKAPDCWDFDNYGSSTYSWTRTTDAHSGSFGERLDISGYSDGDGKLVVSRDMGFCTPSAAPGHKYRITAWYKANAPVAFVAQTRDAIGAYAYWTTSPSFAPSSTWAQASWVTPTVPAGINGVSFGLALSSNGFVTVDDLGFDDAAASGGTDTTPPTASMTAPPDGTRVAGTTLLSATASDNNAVDHVDFLVDGAVVGTVTSGPYNFSWNSANVANGTHTVRARAVDLSGNTTTSSSISITVANTFINLLQNPSLESATGTTPNCWILGGYGLNSFAWTRTSDAHAGSWAEQLDITSYSGGDRKLLPTQDSGACAPAGIPGHTYTFAGWYKTVNDPNLTGTQPVVFAFYRSSAGVWTFWAQSPRLAKASNWTQATWTTPALPAGATNISIGLGLNAVGSITIDDFTLSDNSPPPDTTPPTSTLTCNGGDESGNCQAGYYAGTVQVALEAQDDLIGSGIGSIRYTVDGSDPSPTNGTTYAGPFGISSTATVKYRAYDKAGNAETVHSQYIRVDNTPPVSTISCDSANCASSFYGQSVSMTLDATDGNSGVDQIRYTLDGTDPTLANGRTYLGARSLSATTVVKYRAYDSAGNAEDIHSQLVQVDTTPPTSTIACNLLPCSSSAYTGPVSVSLNSADDAGGSGIAQIRYTTDGTDPTASNGTTYVIASPFTVSQTTTVKYRAYDSAGNAEPVNSQTVTIGAPTSIHLTSPAANATVNGTIDLTATVDNTPAARVDFRVDGALVGQVPSAPYTTSWDTTSVADGQHTIRAEAVDESENVTDSDTITVTVGNQAADTTAPTSTIACNGSACSTGYYRNAVSVTLAANDGSGSGVSQIRYTTDGSDPTATAGTVYSGSFSVAATTTVKYRAFDNAGNAEAVNSQLIDIDSVAPTSSIRCNTVICSSTYSTTAVVIHLAATDTGGSGVDVIRYTTDGTTPNQTNGTTFTGDFTLNSTATVTYRAYDKAGNAEAVNSTLVRVDTTAPNTTIKCNAAACTNGYYAAGPSVSLVATDADSGVASTRYTTNGTDPTSTTGTVYSAPFTVAATTTVKFRSFDRAGNAEAVNTQVVQVDPTAPTVSVTSPANGDGVAGQVSLQASASDNVAVDHVDFLVGGTVVGTASSAPYTYNWDSTTVADGNRSITAKATDTAGNTKTSTAVTVSVRNVNLLKNQSLETASGTTPTCWTLGGYGNNTFAWTRTSDAHAGSFGELMSVTAYTDGDRKLVSTQDTGTCAAPAVAGRTYTATAWYKSTAQPIIFAYYRSSAGVWTYWAQSPRFASASGWTQATWTTPAVPAGATLLSVGMGLNTAGSVTTDDYGLFGNG